MPDRQLAAVKLTIPGKCQISAVGPKADLVVPGPNCPQRGQAALRAGQQCEYFAGRPQHDFDPQTLSPQTEALKAILERLEPQKPQPIPDTAGTG